jgi:uncharacterized membrane protein
MGKAEQEIQDRKIELILGNLLRVGVITSASVVMLGAIIFIYKHGSEIPHYFRFYEQDFNLLSVKQMFEGVLSLHGFSIMQLGIFLLVATPVLRVIFSVVAFIYERDLMYVIFTIIVLSVLLYSLFG